MESSHQLRLCQFLNNQKGWSLQSCFTEISGEGLLKTINAYRVRTVDQESATCITGTSERDLLRAVMHIGL